MKESDLQDLLNRGYGGAAPSGDALLEEMQSLIDGGFLDKISQGKFSFSNNLTWEVIYGAVMFSEKRRLHNLVGKYIEDQHQGDPDNIADLLLHHFESAENYPKTVFYGALAGDRAARMFAKEEAVNSYGRALDGLLQVAGVKSLDHSLVLEKCGDVYRMSGDFQKAVEQYRAALMAWEAVDQDKEPQFVPWEVNRASRSADLCRKTSVSYEYASNYDDAALWIDKAVDFLPSGSARTASRVYAARSAIYFRKGEYKEALDWGERALEIARVSGDADVIANSHNIIANTFTRIGKLNKSIKHLEQAVALYEKEQDFMGMASANNNLAMCYMYSDNLEYAIKHYRVALDVDKKTQNDAMIAIDHNNLGEVYIMQGRLDESEALFGKVITAHEQGYAHDALAGYAMMNISRCKLYRGELDSSRHAIGKALDLIRESGVDVIYLEAQLQQASVLLAQDELEEALGLCKDAKNAIREQGDRLLEAKAARVLAKVLDKKGDMEGAMAEISSSIELAAGMGSKFEEAKSLNEYARMLIEQGRPGTEAAGSLTRAERIFSDIGASRELAYTGLLKGRLD